MRLRPHGTPLLPPVEGRHATTCFGIEHELQVWRGQERLDFRVLLPKIAGHIRGLDPGDPRARRLPSGVALTADGWEAELVTPPLTLSSNAASYADSLLAGERAELISALVDTSDVDRLTGFSTHLNVTVPDELVGEVASEFAARCSIALMKITEPRGSAGLLVRPRRGRLEVCTEYVEGKRLIAAVTLVAACVRGLMSAEALPAVSTPPVKAREKFGYHIAWTQDALAAEVWEWALPHAVAANLDPWTVDACLTTGPPQAASACSTTTRLEAEVGNLDTAARVVDGTLHAETQWLTWSHVVWRVIDSETRRSVHAVMRVHQEGAFLERLDAGELTDIIRHTLRRRTPRRRLLVNAQIGTAALWHELRPAALVPAERDLSGAVPRVSIRAARRRAA